MTPIWFYNAIGLVLIIKPLELKIFDGVFNEDIDVAIGSGRLYKYSSFIVPFCLFYLAICNSLAVLLSSMICCFLSTVSNWVNGESSSIISGSINTFLLQYFKHVSNSKAFYLSYSCTLWKNLFYPLLSFNSNSCSYVILAGSCLKVISFRY